MKDMIEMADASIKANISYFQAQRNKHATHQYLRTVEREMVMKLVLPSTLSASF